MQISRLPRVVFGFLGTSRLIVFGFVGDSSMMTHESGSRGSASSTVDRIKFYLIVVLFESPSSDLF